MRARLGDHRPPNAPPHKTVGAATGSSKVTASPRSWPMAGRRGGPHHRCQRRPRDSSPDLPSLCIDLSLSGGPLPLPPHGRPGAFKTPVCMNLVTPRGDSQSGIFKCFVGWQRLMLERTTLRSSHRRPSLARRHALRHLQFAPRAVDRVIRHSAHSLDVCSSPCRHHPLAWRALALLI